MPDTTPLSNYVGPAPAPAPVSGGEDWLEVHCRTERHRTQSSGFLTALSAARAAARGDLPDAPTVVYLNGQPAAISGQSKRLKAYGGFTHDFVVTWWGAEFTLTASMPTSTQVPDLIITVKGRASLFYGALALLGQIRSMLARYGVSIAEERLVRVDMAIDLPGMPPAGLIHAVCQDHVITRARNRDWHRSTSWTAAIGRLPLRCTIYDKLAESLQRRDGEYVTALCQRRWGGSLPATATRVEFQVGARVLRNKGIGTVADYCRLRADLARYLVHEWVRITDRKPDPANTSRCPLHPDWLRVQAGFAAVYGAPAGLPLTPLQPGRVDVRRLARQMLGLGISACVRRRQFPRDVTDFLFLCRAELLGVLRTDTQLHDLIARKAAELGVELNRPGHSEPAHLSRSQEASPNAGGAVPAVPAEAAI